MNKSTIPNILTFFNLSLGIISIILIFKDHMFIAGLVILLAALIDRYDGKIARKLHAVSAMGKELDSLADLVSFGLAPAFLVWKLSMQDLGIIGCIILLAFPLCGAFRLARYNVTNFENVYMGLPITVAGSIIALDSIIAAKLIRHPEISGITMIILSYLMVSSIKFKKM